MAALRIVVAEDDAAIRELLVHHLTREGFRCTATTDGPSTLRAVRAGTDLLVLDVGLPVVDGFDVVRTLRREGRVQPILMVTARSVEGPSVVAVQRNPSRVRW
jgi:DNA-binding response OmpR family regulator